MEAVGIDLGTTFSAIAISKNGRATIIDNSIGKNTTPSIVSFLGDSMKVGQEAANQMPLPNVEIIYDSKRLIGRKFDDPEVQEDLTKWPFKVVHNEKNVPMIQLTDGRTFYPEEISAIILKQLMSYANKDRMDNPITKAVITVPAYFNNEQREATKSAARIAGIDCLQIINEPTAAAIAYGMATSKPKRTFLVFDLGGGTFDVSILRKDRLKFEVLATHGDTHLGGADFDQLLMDKVLKECKKKGIEVTSRLMRIIKQSCTEAKISLSSPHPNATIEVPGLDIRINVTRAMFESMADELFERCIDAVKCCLKQASLTKKHIDDVILVGGSSAIPKVRTLVRDFFDNDPLEGVNKDEAVAQGAAIRAEQLMKEMKETMETSSKPPKASQKVDDDEDDDCGIVLVDVVPQALGIETANDTVMNVIPRGSPVGRKYIGMTGNLTDYYIKNGLRITVLEGEDKSAKKNNVLDSYTILGISPENLNHPLKIVFDIDINGTLKVSTLLYNGKESGTVIKPEKFMLSEQQMNEIQARIDRMMCASEEAESAGNMIDELTDEATQLKKRVMKERKDNAKAARIIYNELMAWIEDNDGASAAEIKKMREKVISKLQSLL